MKKRFLTILLSVVAVLCLALGLSSCSLFGGTNGGNQSNNSDTQSPSEGLEFTLSEDGTSYELTGMGVCKDTIHQ